MRGVDADMFWYAEYEDGTGDTVPDRTGDVVIDRLKLSS